MVPVPSSKISAANIISVSSKLVSEPKNIVKPMQKPIETATSGSDYSSNASSDRILEVWTCSSFKGASRGSQSHRNRQTLRKRKAVEVDEHSCELLPAKKSNVEHVAEWDIPAGTSNVGQYIVSEVAKGKDATVVLEQTRDLKEKKTKRRRNRKAAKNKGKRMDEDLGHFITDVEFDTLFLQFDKSPLGSLDQLVRRPIVVDVNNDNWFSSLQKVPDEPVCPRLASRIGPQYQARVARFGAFRDKQGGNYLPE